MIVVLAVLVVAASRSGLLATILAAFAAAVVYALVALVHPVHRCPRCKGKRVIVTGKGKRRRSKACRMCKATGRTRRLGSTTISRFAWSVGGPTVRGWLEIAHEKAREKAECE
jgi:hypothetical protein